MVCWWVRWGKREAERGGGQNTIKRQQRVKGTDLMMGGERRGEGAVLSARAPHNERLNFCGWGGIPNCLTLGVLRGRVGKERESSLQGEIGKEREMETTGDPNERGKGEGEPDFNEGQGR